MRPGFSHPSQARAAAHQSWANTADRSERTAPARRRFLARFERQVDPNQTLSHEERAQRAESARKAYFAQLAYRSAVARQASKHEGDEQ
jgi:hypothetical protein